MQSKLLILRKEHHLTQKQLAGMLGITPKTYGLKERGESAFDADEMWKISTLFKLPIEEIFLPRCYQNGDKEVAVIDRKE